MEKAPFTGEVIGCAIEVHRALGPKLLESTHQLRTGLPINVNVQRLTAGIERFRL